MGLRHHRRSIALGIGLSLVSGVFVATQVDAASKKLHVSLPAKPGTHRISFKGHAPFNNGQANLFFDDTTGACDPTDPKGSSFRDEHHVQVSVPKHLKKTNDVLIRFQVEWKAANEATEDLRMDLFGPDKKLVASSDGSQTQEGISLTSATPGDYDMVVCAFQDTPGGQDYTGSVTASLLKPPPTHRARHVKAPAYRQFEAPKGSADDAGEPSIGNNWKTGRTFFTSNIHEYSVHFNDKLRTSKWTEVNQGPNPSNQVSLDPIGYTDSKTGRTFVSQLLFACSGAVYTDDDFKTTNDSQGCGSSINGFDHQTFGGGPYPHGMKGSTSYPHAVYYCSQAQALALGGASCARSDDGGQTFQPAVEIFHAKCSGLHGHVRVAPDGTVYVPNDNCHGRQGVAVSTDAGKHWTVRTVPGSHAGESDPSVSVGKHNRVYFGYSDGTGRPMIAVSRNRGKKWSRPTDAGGRFHLRNSEFAEVIAGDDKRAAFAFLGTATRGSTQADSFGKTKDGKRFTGATWRMYIATTYDGGKHWTTVDATPKDPVQRGCVWNSGGSVPCRNLLDFNDITLTKSGRVMVGYSDGCLGPRLDAKANCIKSKSVAADTLTQHGAIIRQMSGRGLFAAYDRHHHPKHR